MWSDFLPVVCAAVCAAAFYFSKPLGWYLWIFTISSFYREKRMFGLLVNGECFYLGCGEVRSRLVAAAPISLSRLNWPIRKQVA